MHLLIVLCLLIDNYKKTQTSLSIGMNTLTHRIPINYRLSISSWTIISIQRASPFTMKKDREHVINTQCSLPSKSHFSSLRNPMNSLSHTHKHTISPSVLSIIVSQKWGVNWWFPSNKAKFDQTYLFHDKYNIRRYQLNFAIIITNSR